MDPQGELVSAIPVAPSAAHASPPILEYQSGLAAPPAVEAPVREASLVADGIAQAVIEVAVHCIASLVELIP